MSEHTLKTPEPYFSAVQSGQKTFDVRINDRGYQKGDTVHLVRTEPNDISQPGSYFMTHCDQHECLRRRVGFVFSGDATLRDDGGIKPGYVVLGLIDLEGDHGASHGVG